jgi:hypothetical protein
VPPAYRGLSRHKRVMIEISAGVAVLTMFAIAVSVQTPVWLQIAGWALLVVYWIGWCVIALPKWRRRVLRGRSV